MRKRLTPDGETGAEWIAMKLQGTDPHRRRRADQPRVLRRHAEQARLPGREGGRRRGSPREDPGLQPATSSSSTTSCRSSRAGKSRGLLKHDPAYGGMRDTPIIMFSAMNEVKDRIDGLRAGRGRLHHQAVQLLRGAGAHPRRAAQPRADPAARCAGRSGIGGGGVAQQLARLLHPAHQEADLRPARAGGGRAAS